MSSSKYGSSRARASGASFGRCESPELSRAMSGTLAARHTSGGANCPSQAPARIVLWLKQRDAVLAVRLVHALYRAFFVDDIDISAPENAVAIAGKCGVDAAAARAAIDDPAVKDALKQENDAAIARGVFGSPFIIIDGEPFWGMDRLDQAERWLATGGW